MNRAALALLLLFPSLSFGQVAAGADIRPPSLTPPPAAAPAPVAPEKEAPKPVESYWVVFQKLGSVSEARKKQSELFNRGIRDGEIATDKTDGPYVITLGVYSSKAQAEERLSNLQGRGVRTARIIVRNQSADSLTAALLKSADELKKRQTEAAAKVASSPAKTSAVEKNELPAESPAGQFILPRRGSEAKPALPVLGKTSVNADETRNQVVVHLTSGANEILSISATMPNRISTPFAKPEIVDNGMTDKESYRVVGSDIFIVPTGTLPIGLFIYDGDRSGGSVANLTLLPQASLLAQNITLMFGMAPDGTSAMPEAAGQPSDYVDNLRTLMRSLALGMAPSGFSQGNLDLGITRIGGLSVKPEKQYASGRMYLYRYRIENISNEVIELDERSFYEDGVRAVSFYPVVRLEPRAQTWVFIAADGEAVTSGSRIR